MSETDMSKDQETLEETAAYWAMRLSSSDCGPADRAAFETWRTRHISHAEAFERTERSLAFLDRHLTNPALENMVDDVMAQTKPKPSFWQNTAFASAAMVLVIFISTIVFFSPILDQEPGPNEGTIKVYDTAIGERSTIMLADGSTVTLNTNSRVEIDFNETQRGIQLIRGQALFEVAKNSSWPFVVKAGKQRITALGTIFDVRLTKINEEVQVALVEGRVAVDEFVIDDIQSEPLILPENRIELTAGERLVASAITERIAQKFDLEEITSWRDGRIIFRDKPLDRAIAEVNRYTVDQLRLSEGSRLRDIRVSGVFNTGQLAPFVLALQTIHGVDSQRTAKNEITLLVRE